jgi:hypothetical protein
MRAAVVVVMLGVGFWPGHARPQNLQPYRDAAQLLSGRLLKCIAEWAGNDSAAAKNLDVEFILRKDGSVSKTSLSHNDFGDGPVAECLLSEAKRGRFPRPLQNRGWRLYAHYRFKSQESVELRAPGVSATYSESPIPEEIKSLPDLDDLAAAASLYQDASMPLRIPDYPGCVSKCRLRTKECDKAQADVLSAIADRAFAKQFVATVGLQSQ